MKYSREGFVDLRGFRTWYGVFEGHDDRKLPLLCVHGGPAIPHDYLLPLRRLADGGRTVIFYDQLGCGNSDRPTDPSLWQTQTFLDELDAVRGKLGLQVTHLYGHSCGGHLLIAYALRQPSGVASMTLASAFPGIDICIREQLRLVEEMEPGAREKAVLHTARGTLNDREFQDIQSRFLARHVTKLDPWPEELQRAFARMGSDVYAAMWGTGGQFSVNGAMQRQEYEERLTEIRTPTHVVHGRHDYIPPAIGEAIQRGIPGSRLAIMEESAHLPMHDEPDGYLALLEGFLEEVEHAGPM